MNIWAALLKLFRPKPKPPRETFVFVTLRDARTDQPVTSLGTGNASLFQGAALVGSGVFEDPANLPGRIKIGTLATGTLKLVVLAPGYQLFEETIHNPQQPGEGDALLVPKSPAILVRDDLALVTTDTHEPYFGLGLTGFPLQRDWRFDRPRAMRFLDYCETNELFPRWLGFFLFSTNPIQRFADIGDYIPDDRWADDFYTLGVEIGRRGLRGKCSLVSGYQFAALKQARPDLQQYLAEAEDVRKELPFLFVDGGNEYPFNGFDPSALGRPSVDGLWSRGSNGANAQPPLNPWTMFDLHTRRDAKATQGLKDIRDIQFGLNEWRQVAAPGGTDEMVSIGEFPNEDGKLCLTEPDDVYQFVSNPFGSYVVLHVRNGIYGDVPGPNGDRCVQAGRLAASHVPARFRANTDYTRGGPDFEDSFGLIDSPDVNTPDKWWDRAYGRIAGNEQLVAILGRTSNLTEERLQAAPGWVILERQGFTPGRTTVVRLART